MTKLVFVSGFDGIDGQGDRIVVAHAYNAWGDDLGFGVWALRENYKLGRTTFSWRFIYTGLTKEEAISMFNKKNKA